MFLDHHFMKKTMPIRAVIREAECIGCTKCIQACPVDAILGMAKQMHTVISSECTGCELCIEPCPVDCIDLVTTDKEHSIELAQKRTLAKEERLKKSKIKQNALQLIADRRAYVQAAVKRTIERRGNRRI